MNSDYCKDCIPIPIANKNFLVIDELNEIMKLNHKKLQSKDLFWQKEITISPGFFKKIDSRKFYEITIDPQKYQFKRSVKNIDSYFPHAVKIRIDQVYYFGEKNIAYATLIDMGCF